MEGRSRNGSFDTLRLSAALIVFHSHSFAIAGLPEPTVPGHTWGRAAVIVFFAISGYWVTRSALERSLIGYGVARVLRIVPGLLVCCLFTIVFCALATSESVNQYFNEARTWMWVRNALPFFLPRTDELPRVFENGAVHEINSSLWTLPYEVFFYILVAVAALFGPKGMRAAMVAVAVFAVAVVFGRSGPEQIRFGYTILELRWIPIFGGAFFFGASLNEASDQRLSQVLLVSAMTAYATSNDPILAPIVAVFVYGSLGIWIGRRLNLDRLVTRGRDISYGVYIYAFPVEQIAVRIVRPHHSPEFLVYYLGALAATLVLAAFSWALVERPSLNAKTGLAKLIERGISRLLRSPVRASALDPKGAGRGRDRSQAGILPT